MIKKLTGFLDYGFFAEVTVVIFAAVFVAIVLRTLLMKRDVSDENARIVLDDKTETTV